MTGPRRAPSGNRTPDVVIIGAGVVGIATALELVRRGASVTVVDRGPRPGSGSSHGNAGIVGTTHVVPLASAQAFRDGLRWMLRRRSPFSIAPRAAVIPWVARFLLAANEGAYERGAAVLQRLAIESLELHRGYAEDLGTDLVRRGFLNVYVTQRAFEAARTHLHAGMEAVNGDTARELCPQLAVLPAGAIFSPGDAHCDPARLVAALAESAVDQEVELRMGLEVYGIRRRQGGDVLWTSGGDLPFGEVVIAAGAWSPSLVAGLPIRLPIQGGKGYHVDLEPHADDTAIPVWFGECRVVATPFPSALRLTGMLQIAGTDLSVDRGRVDTILSNARRLLTGIADRRVTSMWRGLRPCSPDGLPIVGRTQNAERVILATGHGMWGLQLAPVTARLVADLIVDGRRDDALDALDPGRFENLWRRRSQAALGH